MINLENFITLLDESALDLALWVSLGICLIIGSIFFVLAGTYKVKKGNVIIIEKVHEYYKTVGEGIHYFNPLKYRRVGYYQITKQDRVVLLNNVKKIVITYEIFDAKMYHYSGKRIESFIEEIRRKNDEVTEEILKSQLETIGVKYISVR